MQTLRARVLAAAWVPLGCRRFRTPDLRRTFLELTLRALRKLCPIGEAPRRLEDGADIRTVQELPGHRYVGTPMIYIHVLARGPLGVRSPADRL